MACFTVSAAVAIGVGVARHIVKRHENAKEAPTVDTRFGKEIKWSKK